MTAPARLLALRLQGFKSFAERTVVEFGPGISAVVGPNGSGKSNLADALRWALGEQGRALRTPQDRGRHLRRLGASGGARAWPTSRSSSTTPTGCCRSTTAVLELGRRLYRSGENDYLLNRAAGPPARPRRPARRGPPRRQRVPVHRPGHGRPGARAAARGAPAAVRGGGRRPPPRAPPAAGRGAARRGRGATSPGSTTSSPSCDRRPAAWPPRPSSRRPAATAGEELAAALVAGRPRPLARGGGAPWRRPRRPARSGRGEADARWRRCRRPSGRRGGDLGRAGRPGGLERGAAGGPRAGPGSRSRDLQLREARLASDAGGDRARPRADPGRAARCRGGPRRPVDASVAAPLPGRDLELEAALAGLERDLADALAELGALRAARQARGDELATLRRAEAARAAELEAARRRAAEAERRAADERARAERRGGRPARAGGCATRRPSGRTAEAGAAERLASEAREAARTAADQADGASRAAGEAATAAGARAAAHRGTRRGAGGPARRGRGRGIARAARRVGGRRIDEELQVEPRFRAAVEAALGEVAGAYLVGREALGELAGERGTLVVEVPGVAAARPSGGATAPNRSFRDRVVRARRWPPGRRRPARSRRRRAAAPRARRLGPGPRRRPRGPAGPARRLGRRQPGRISRRRSDRRSRSAAAAGALDRRAELDRLTAELSRIEREAAEPRSVPRRRRSRS